jgi:hypothetical protein
MDVMLSLDLKQASKETWIREKQLFTWAFWSYYLTKLHNLYKLFLQILNIKALGKIGSNLPLLKHSISIHTSH